MREAYKQHHSKQHDQGIVRLQQCQFMVRTMLSHLRLLWPIRNSDVAAYTLNIIEQFEEI
jgi:hypothetical protein